MATGPISGVRVVGMRELRQALTAAGDLLEPELRAGLKDIAGGVAREARRRLESDVATSTGRAAGSIRTFSTSRSAGVRAGGSSIPYYGWLDFGGTIRHQGARHSHTRAHLIRREFVARGRYLYPAADSEAATAAPKVERLLDRLFVKAGFTD